MTSSERLEIALADPQTAYAELCRIALSLCDEGLSEDQIIADFYAKLDECLSPEREREDDLLRDVLNRLTGWCSPQARLVS